jgi:hypothetical protein
MVQLPRSPAQPISGLVAEFGAPDELTLTDGIATCSMFSAHLPARAAIQESATTPHGGTTSRRGGAHVACCLQTPDDAVGLRTAVPAACPIGLASTVPEAHPFRCA